MAGEGLSDEFKDFLIDGAIAVTRYEGELEISEEIRAAANSMERDQAIEVASDGLKKLRKGRKPLQSSC
jgi:hypothetical protein